MKKIKRLLAAAGLLLAVGMTGCHDDDLEYETPGELQGTGDDRVTVVYMRSPGVGVPDASGDVSVLLEDPSALRTLKFTGHIRHGGDTRGDTSFACHIRIGSTDIPDGVYFLKIEGDNVPELGQRKVKFVSSVGEEAPAGSMSYDDLEGSGTQSDPYRINDDGDFLTMIWYLEDDPDNGYGKYFLQTESFDVPRRSQMIDGHVYAPVQFSGTYDGGGHELRNLTYQGGSNQETDSDIGIFRMLFSATVKNLTISRAMVVNAASRVGLVAGRAYGYCNLENITIDGSITASGSDIGGLIGESFAALRVNNIKIGAFSLIGSENAAENVGLLVGEQYQNDLTVDGVTTPGHVFTVTGHRNVGGLAGLINVNSAKLSNITLEHSVDQETNDVKIVYGSEKYVGGLIGNLQVSHAIELNNVNVKAPVRGGQDVGGLIGHAFVVDATVNGALVSSVVNGGKSVGGFFGYLGYMMSGAKIIFDCESRPVRYVVKSSGDAGVKGDTYVGGMIGYYDATDGDMWFRGKVEIAVNVKGGSHVGGAFGYATKLDKFNPYDIDFSSATMRVEASGSNAGGVIGLAHHCSLDGGKVVSPINELPDIDACFSGVVTAAENAGGIVGRQEESGSIDGMACAATVTASVSDAGGIVGRLDYYVAHCVSYGRVDARQSAGGIYGSGYDTANISVYRCVNYGDVHGDSNAGGIGGYTYMSKNPSLNIRECYNSGNIKSSVAGGIIGLAGCKDTGSKNTYFDIKYSGNHGRVEGMGGNDGYSAGIVAKMDHRHGYVAQCCNKGEISGPAQKAVAGIVAHMGDGGGSGLHYNYGLVTRCINYGKISSSDANTRVGGVVGILEYGFSMDYGHKITDCANYGELPTKQKHDNGGILGYTQAYTNTYRTFNKGKVSHGNAIIGDHAGASLFHHSHNYFLEDTGKDWPSSTKVRTADLCKESTYADFDFTNIWCMTSDGPQLYNCPFQ